MDEKKKFSPPPLPKIRPAGITGVKPPVALATPAAPKAPGVPAAARPAGTPPAAGMAIPVQQEAAAEKRIQELQNQLLEEREKLLLQTIRSKEEEATAGKVEDSIRQIQEKLRREKTERELQEHLERAQDRVKELERRLAEERETWVATIKGQMSQRDVQDKDLEHTFELRIRDIEKKWHEEKDQWIDALRDKDGQIAAVKNQVSSKEDELNRNYEKRLYSINAEKARAEDELDAVRDLARERAGEVSALKAELALVSSELGKEKERAEKLQRGLERLKNEGDLLTRKLEEKDKEYFILRTQAGIIHAKGKAESERLQGRVKQLEEELKGRMQEHALAAQGASAREAELKAVIDRAAFEKAALEDRVAQKDESIKTLEARITNQTYREKEFLVKEAELGKDLKKAVDELEAAKNAVQEFRSRLEETQKGFLGKEEELKNLRKSKDDELKDLAAAKDAEVRNLTAARGVDAEKHAADIKELIANLNSARISEIEKIKDEYEKRVSELSRQAQELFSEREKQNAKIIELTSALSAMGQRVEGAERSFSEESRKSLETQRENELLKSEISGKVRIIEEMKAQLGDIDKEVSERLAIEEKEYKRRLERLEQINDELHRKLAQRDSEIKEYAEKAEKVKADFREALDENEEKTAQLREKLAEVQKKLTELTELSEEHTAVIAGKDAEMRSVRERAESEKTQVREMSHRFEEEIKSLRGMVGERNEKVHELDGELKALFGKLEEEKTKAESERSKAAGERAKCDREIENLNRIWDSKVKSYEIKVADLEKKRAAELESQRLGYENEIANKTAENENIVAKLDSTWKEFHSRFLEEYKVVESRLQEKEKELQSLQENVNRDEQAGFSQFPESARGGREAVVQPEEAVTETTPVSAVSEDSEAVPRQRGGSVSTVKNAAKTVIDWLNKPIMHN